MPILTVADLLKALEGVPLDTPVAQFADRAHNDGDQSIEVDVRDAADGRPRYVEISRSGDLHPALDVYLDEDDDEQDELAQSGGPR